MRILLIEPDEVLAQVYSFFLAGENLHQVMLAANGQQAMDLIDQLRPDLIILEPEMKAHDGMEFIHELRSYADLENIPIIINSISPAYYRLGEEPAASMFGISSVLYKPSSSLAKLKSAISQFV